MKILVLCTTDSMIWNFLQVHIKRLQKDGHEVECACSRTGQFYDELVTNGLILHELEFTRFPFSTHNIKAYLKLKKLIKDEKYDAIFCHEPVGGAMGRLVVSSGKTKVVYMAHGFHFYKKAPLINNCLYKTIEWLLSWKTDVLITINKEDFDASLKMHAKRNIHLNGIGVDTTKFKRDHNNYLREKYNIDNRALILLSVGELIHRKNHEIIIQSLAQLNNINIHYFIAGDGELYDYLNNLVTFLNINNKVTFLGYCRNINELCNSCDVFVLPSIQEGLSLALMEAMACGKPVIASKIRGNVDLIEKGGYLVRTNDIAGYKEAIIKLYSDSKLQEQLGEYNYDSIKQYDIKVIENQISEIFQKL